MQVGREEKALQVGRDSSGSFPAAGRRLPCVAGRMRADARERERTEWRLGGKKRNERERNEPHLNQRRPPLRPDASSPATRKGRQRREGSIDPTDIDGELAGPPGSGAAPRAPASRGGDGGSADPTAESAVGPRRLPPRFAVRSQMPGSL